MRGKYEVEILYASSPCSSLSVEPNYPFAFELKYLKQADAQRLATVKAEGLAQMQDYLRREKLHTLTDLRAWLIVFVGAKAQVVQAVTA